jgi:hypothetical protein
MEINGALNVAVLAAGGTTTISVDSTISRVNLYTSGAVSLLASAVITYSGTPVDGMCITTHCYLPSLNLNGSKLTIFGSEIQQNIITNGEFIITSCYNSGASKFVSVVSPTFIATQFIGSAIIKDDAITQDKIADDAVGVAQLEAITRGSLIVGGAANAPTLKDFKTSGQIPIGDGTDINSVAVSGDVTISSTGVTTIGANKITEAMLNFTLTSYLEVSRTLTSAEILALRTTAITLLSAPGANKYYELISVSAYNNYNSTTYNAGTDVLNLEVNGVALWTLPNTFIEATSSTATYGTKVVDALIATNTAVNLRMSSADPTTGNGTIKVSAIYRIITGE